MANSSSYEAVGVVKQIMELKTLTNNFTKREFVLTTEDDYPQVVQFECVKQQCALLDALAPGDRVRVEFRIRGREYKERFFVNLQAFKVEKMGADGSSVTVEEDGGPPPADDDAMPF
jgi:hypothetical protein